MKHDQPARRIEEPRVGYSAALPAIERQRAQRELLDWYARMQRPLLWRQTRDPYRILVSEVMLQQTQVERVTPFYERFLAQFPDERALAEAGDEAIHRAWKGLGYPNRVERLRAACRAVLVLGQWPDTPAGLQTLPGIGPYTAGAVACFAFARAVPVVDTNVARVYARRDGLTLPLDRDALWAHAAQEVPSDDAIPYTNALMDLGATVCTARTARCTICPWLSRCSGAGDEARQAATANPLKIASAVVAYGDPITERSRPRLHIVLALIHHDGRYLVAKRPLNKPQGGRWEFPGGKREAGEDDRRAVAREVQEELGVEILAARHILSFAQDIGSRYLHFHCFRCRVFAPEKAQPLASDALRWVTPAELLTLDFPTANRPLIERMRAYHRL